MGIEMCSIALSMPGGTENEGPGIAKLLVGVVKKRAVRLKIQTLAARKHPVDIRQEQLDGKVVEWMEHVSDEQYLRA